jgi:HEAT repeat protein
MHRVLAAVLLLGVLGYEMGRSLRGADEEGTPSPDEQTLRNVGLATDGPALLSFFRTRTQERLDAPKLATLLKQLADPAAEVHGKASGELIALGPLCVPALRQVVNDLESVETANRARRCLQAIEAPGGSAIPSSAARVVALRKPAGAAEVLLAYLPFADDDTVAEQVKLALAAVAYPDGKPDPVLLKALDDPLAVRRAVAAEALCQADRPETRGRLRKLMQDPKGLVRLRVAIALAQLGEADAVPVLIELVSELPAPQNQVAEEYLKQLAGEWAPAGAAAGTDEVARRIRRDAWAAWWKHTEGPALLDEFHKRTLSDEERDKVLALIRKLGDASYEVRERTLTELVGLDRRAVPLLRQAARGTDPEVVRRVDICLQRIGKNVPAPLPLVAARLVALRKPAGASEMLLRYLPFAEDEAMIGEVQEALNIVAFHEGQPDPAVIKGLDDKLPQRRMAAAEALCRGTPDQRRMIRRLLEDSDRGVRLRVAVALANARERDSIPVLIDLLGELPPEQAGLAQEILYLLAGDKSPPVALGTDAAGRMKCRDAWSAWWRENGAMIDLNKLDRAAHMLGYTLLVAVTNNGIGKVIELGRDGKPRWQIENLAYPVDAYVLPGNRVLVAEYNGMKVTERDQTGKVLWEKANLGGRTVNAQRLANGHTFIATDRQVMEVDRTGKEVFTHQVGNGITAAHKSPNGQIVVLANNGTCLRLDANGKELKSFPSNRGSGWTSGIDVMPTGRILISQPDRGKVAEFDADGKQLWEADAPDITTATRLLSGNTLVASHSGQRTYELDRQGKVVWEHKDALHIFRARRR